MTDAVNPEATAAEAERPQQCPATQKERFWDVRASHLFNIILAAALVLLAGAQLIVYQRQAQLMSVQNSISKTQSGIFSDQTSVTKSVQRAFVSVSELTFESAEPSFPEGTQKVTPLIRNNGPTPALDVAIASADPRSERMYRKWGLPPQQYDFAAWKVGAPIDPDDIFQSEIGKYTTIKHATIGPTGSITASTLSTYLPKDAGMAAQSNQIGRFIFGALRYKDIFRVEHVTKYCFRIDGSILNGSTQITQQGICSHWNCTDEYCAEDKAAYESEFQQALKDWKPPPLPKEPAPSPSIALPTPNSSSPAK